MSAAAWSTAQVSWQSERATFVNATDACGRLRTWAVSYDPWLRHVRVAGLRRAPAAVLRVVEDEARRLADAHDGAPIVHRRGPRAL